MTFKPRMSFGQIINMNVGFFGIQYSFGLQQSAVNPIYDFLGATPDQLPLLNLAGPVTGLLIQPLIGTMSDKTWHPRFGRRLPVRDLRFTHLPKLSGRGSGSEPDGGGEPKNTAHHDRRRGVSGRSDAPPGDGGAGRIPERRALRAGPHGACGNPCKVGCRVRGA